ncbi:MAG TPA: chemotaxis protein CheW [Xanthomonadales bacterium]|nr:chemotaxis protein CheW [Xanthomonadales bacterium]
MNEIATARDLMNEIPERLDPFEALADFERRAAAHVAGAAEQVEAPGLWRGIAFRVGDRLMMSGIHEVNEILMMPAMTTVPGTKPWLLGVANIRGNLVAVVDLRYYLEGDRTPIGDRSRLLLARQPGGAVGLLVDEVLGQRNVTDENIPLDEGEDDERYARYIPRRYELDGRVWNVFSMATLVKTPGFIQAAG